MCIVPIGIESCLWYIARIQYLEGLKMSHITVIADTDDCLNCKGRCRNTVFYVQPGH